MAMKYSAMALAVAFFISGMALAYPGRLDKDGGHWDHDKKEYHYHKDGKIIVDHSKKYGESARAEKKAPSEKKKSAIEKKTAKEKKAGAEEKKAEKKEKKEIKKAENKSDGEKEKKKAPEKKKIEKKKKEAPKKKAKAVEKKGK